MHVHVVSHIADLDGLMSALLIKQAEEISGNSVTVRFADYYDYLEKIAQAEGDKIYVADLGIDPLTQPSFKKTMMEKGRRAQVIYIDHHPDDPQVLTHLAQSGTTVVHSREDCAGVLTYDHLKDLLPSRYFLYAVYAAIGDHMERGKLAAPLMEKADAILAYFEASLLTLGLVQDDEAQRLRLLEALARDPYYHDPELVQPALRQIEAVSSFISKIQGLSPTASGRFSWLAAEADFFTGRAAHVMLQELPLKISVAYRLDLARNEYQISLRRAEFACLPHQPDLLASSACNYGPFGKRATHQLSRFQHGHPLVSPFADANVLHGNVHVLSFGQQGSSSGQLCHDPPSQGVGFPNGPLHEEV